MNRYDLVIVGAGPAGLSCAIEAKKAGFNALVVDKGGIVDAIQHFKRDMFFFSTPELLEIGSVPFVVPTMRPTSLDCVIYYRKVAEHYGIACSFFDRIDSIRRADGGFELRSRGGAIRHAAAAVAATGYCDTPSPLGVPGESLLHVSHFYRDPLPYYRRDVVVVGGKNSAVEAALDLHRHGARVTVVHRGEALSQGVKYWLLPDFENRVAEGSIALRLSSAVREIRERSVVVTSREGGTGEIGADAVFILIGYRPDVALLKAFGVEIDPDTLAPLHDPATMETPAGGLYVAGGLVGGKHNNKVFIENGREHGKKIVAALTRSTGG